MFPFFLDTDPVSPPNRHRTLWYTINYRRISFHVKHAFLKKQTKVWKNSRKDAKPRGNPANHKNIVGGTEFSILA